MKPPEKCAICDEFFNLLLESKVKYHLFDGDIHLVLSKNPENMVTDHIVPTCQRCSIITLNGLLQMEITEILDTLKGIK